MTSDTEAIWYNLSIYSMEHFTKLSSILTWKNKEEKYSLVIALTPIFPKINSIKSSEWNAIFCMLLPKEFKEKRGQNSAEISWNWQLTSADFHLLTQVRKVVRESFISCGYKRTCRRDNRDQWLTTDHQSHNKQLALPLSTKEMQIKFFFFFRFCILQVWCI